MTAESPLPDLIEVCVTAPLDEWHLITSPYVETYWLPIVGPTPWVLARRLVLTGAVAGWGESVTHDTDVLGRMVGVRLGQLNKAIQRLNWFGLTHWGQVGGVPQLVARGAWPALPRRHFDRISDFLPAPY